MKIPLYTIKMMKIPTKNFKIIMTHLKTFRIIPNFFFKNNSYKNNFQMSF